MEKQPFEDASSPTKIVILHCHASFPGCKWSYRGITSVARCILRGPRFFLRQAPPERLRLILVNLVFFNQYSFFPFLYHTVRVFDFFFTKWKYTLPGPPKFNIFEGENGWLEYDSFSFPIGIFTYISPLLFWPFFTLM